MDEAVRQRLLQLNRDFYTAVAEPFNETRQGWTPGKSRLLTYLPTADGRQPFCVADIGCGNGRFALMLESLGTKCRYRGVDGNARLLALAAEQTAKLKQVTTTFAAADLADKNWIVQAGMTTGYDLVVCLATMQHIPGYVLRRRLMSDLGALLKPGGLLAVSAWQFLGSERFRSRLIDWHEVGLAEDDVEASDALLPWKQETYAIRYVHQIDKNEMSRLAAQADLTIAETYRADGKEGNLNLYTILTRKA